MTNDDMKEFRKQNEKLWSFVRQVFPFANGNLDTYVDVAIEELKFRNIRGIKNDTTEDT